MKKYKVVVSILFVLIIIVSSVVSVFAATVSAYNNKISEHLKSIVSENKLDSIPVYIFLKKCDKSVVYKNLQEKHNYNTEAYENKVLYYKEIVPEIIIDGKTVKNILGGKAFSRELIDLDNDKSSLNIETRKKINQAMINDVNGYLGDYRKEIVNVVGSYVTEFTKEYEELIDEIILQPDSGECVLAKVSPYNISKLAKISIVERIDYFENVKMKNSSWNATSVTQSDSETGLGSNLYNAGTGYDGTGIKIGIIEAELGRFDEDNYNLSEANLSFVPTPFVANAHVASHATYVTTLICGKKMTLNGDIYGGAATGATVYQTSIQYIEELLDAILLYKNRNVNVINLSAGVDFPVGYTSFDQLVDLLLENNRLCMVVAAGNEGERSGDVTTPGRAYNAITVGNLCTKLNNGSYFPYEVNYRSSIYEEDYMANKPDVVAPGTDIFIGSDTGCPLDIDSGTSFSAPIVTAIVAQIMQSDCLAIFNPNAAKNYIVCGASNDNIIGTTASYGALMDESGAGLVNAVKSYECSNFGTEYYGVYLASQNAPTEYETIATFNLSRGDNIRVALTFEKEENISLTSEYGNNIDIRLVRKDSDLLYCVESKSTNNNVEVIDATIDDASTYLLQVRLTNSILASNINNDLHYWVSWRID